MLFIARQDDEFIKLSMGLKTAPNQRKKDLTFCLKYDILLSVAGLMRSRKSGNSRSSPITHQAKRLEKPVVVLKRNHPF